MTDYLVFRLYGPMCAWGEIAVGGVRASAGHPSKSAVLGLVAAALRIRRDEEDVHRLLAESYGMSALVTSMGAPLVDYHTAQVPASGAGRNARTFATRREELASRPRHELNTILSKRDYRVDARADVALWSRSPAPFWPLERLRAALESPGFVLYLGRKSCPLSLPMEPQVLSAPSITAAFASARFHEVEELGVLPSSKRRDLYWDEDGEPGVTAGQVLLRRDEPVSRRRWQFDTRRESHASIGEES